MAMLKATPRGIYNGVRDLSKRAAVPTAEQIPTHLPYVPLLAERGDEEMRFAIGDAFNQFYGDLTADLKSIYATHQTVLASFVMSRGNAIMAKRLRPAGATTAMLRLSLEVIRHRMPKYNRNADGSFQTNAAGNPIPETVDGSPTGTATNATVEGFRLVWHVTRAPYAVVGDVDTATFGNGRSVASYRAGSLAPAAAGGETLSAYDGVTIGTAAASSTLYPIIDFEVASFGKYGNNCGLRFDAPTAISAQAGNATLMEGLKTFLYRLTCLEKEADQSTPTVVTTLASEPYIDLSLRSEVRNNGIDYSFDTAFVPAYRNLKSDGVVPSIGVFGKVKLYDNYLTTVLTLLQGGSSAAGDVLAAPGEASFDADVGRFGDSALTLDRMHQINIFTGLDPQGRPYESIEVSASVRMGGVSMGANTVHYATGGSDGLQDTGNPAADRLANLRIYDSLVKADADAWGEKGSTTHHYLDDARYPVSHVWDSGFSLKTKLSLLKIMGRRKDVAVRLATQAVADYAIENNDSSWDWKAPNTRSEEVAIGTALRTAIGLYPESTLHGTPACRASVFGHCSKLLLSDWTRKLPLTIEVAYKYAKAFGASSGVWDSQAMPDGDENNILELFDPMEINLSWKPDDAYETDWDLGINFVRYFDMNRLFYPAYQTAYPDDTSVLNDDITINLVVELEKICQRTWRRLTGKQLPNELFISESNRIIREQVSNRFADRYVVIPNTMLTGGDLQRGFSWTCEIDFYAAKAKTAGSFTINSRRIEDLVA